MDITTLSVIESLSLVDQLVYLGLMLSFETSSFRHQTVLGVRS